MRILILSILLSLLAACGTTSGIKQSGEADAHLDFSDYSSIVVLDFIDGTKEQHLPEYVGKDFADIIAEAIKRKGIFEVVSREKIEGSAIIIVGNITRYAEGDASLRLMIGFGAGSTYFDALVEFKDSTSGERLGEILVDKNSWGLGGALAASQTVVQFMNEAAEKVSNEVEKAKSLTK